MAENESLTPEKQLLKLIENPKQTSVKVENAKREGRKWFSFPAFKGRLDFWKGASGQNLFSLKNFTKSAHGVKRINVILKFLIVVMTIYAAYSIFEMATDIKKSANLILPPDEMTEQIEEPPVGLKNVSYYLEKIRDQNIFTAADAPEEVVEYETEEDEYFAEEMVDVTKECSLVGIAWSDDPEAMIEDTKLNRTFFMKRGQTMSNGVRIVAIFKDRVVLSYKDKEFELR